MPAREEAWEWLPLVNPGSRDVAALVGVGGSPDDGGPRDGGRGPTGDGVMNPGGRIAAPADEGSPGGPNGLGEMSPDILGGPVGMPLGTMGRNPEGPFMVGGPMRPKAGGPKLPGAGGPPGGPSGAIPRGGRGGLPSDSTPFMLCLKTNSK